MKEIAEDVALLSKQHVLDVMGAHRDLFNTFAVKELFLFGSVVRDEATPESDIDFLVEFDRSVGLFTLLGLQAYLEELLGRSVDLGTPNLLRSHLRETVLREESLPFRVIALRMQDMLAEIVLVEEIEAEHWLLFEAIALTP